MPAIILKKFEFCKKICPIKDAVAPKIMNTVENPKQNNTKGNKLFLSWFRISSKDWPETNDTFEFQSIKIDSLANFEKTIIDSSLQFYKINW